MHIWYLFLAGFYTYSTLSAISYYNNGLESNFGKSLGMFLDRILGVTGCTKPNATQARPPYRPTTCFACEPPRVIDYPLYGDGKNKYVLHPTDMKECTPVNGIGGWNVLGILGGGSGVDASDYILSLFPGLGSLQHKVAGKNTVYNKSVFKKGSPYTQEQILNGDETIGYYEVTDERGNKQPVVAPATVAVPLYAVSFDDYGGSGDVAPPGFTASVPLSSGFSVSGQLVTNPLYAYNGIQKISTVSPNKRTSNTYSDAYHTPLWDNFSGWDNSSNLSGSNTYYAQTAVTNLSQSILDYKTFKKIKPVSPYFFFILFCVNMEGTVMILTDSFNVFDKTGKLLCNLPLPKGSVHIQEVKRDIMRYYNVENGHVFMYINQPIVDPNTCCYDMENIRRYRGLTIYYNVVPLAF